MTKAWSGQGRQRHHQSKPLHRLGPRPSTPHIPNGHWPNPARIHLVAGLTGDRTALVTTRPCRTPHQTISDAGLIGGGHVPMPGDVSLAPPWRALLG